MKKTIFSLVLCTMILGSVTKGQAQSDKNKKSRYYQNNTNAPEEFNVQGFYMDPEKKDVEKKTEETEYDVKIRRNQSDSRYYEEQRVIKKEDNEEAEEPKVERRKRRRVEAYPTTYGSYKTYDAKRDKYDRYYGNNPAPATAAPVTAAPEEATIAPPPPPPPPPPPAKPAKVKRKQVEEREIGMTPNELEYKTTVVKKRYTNLDVLCDDLDLAKIQRPVFKGICTECSRDVDKIITDKNMSSLEKNYDLKQCYMLRDKRLRETLDDDQYKKFLRIKDADEYLIITKDLELRDGVNR